MKNASQEATLLFREEREQIEMKMRGRTREIKITGTILSRLVSLSAFTRFHRLKKAKKAPLAVMI